MVILLALQEVWPDFGYVEGREGLVGTIGKRDVGAVSYTHLTLPTKRIV